MFTQPRGFLLVQQHLASFDNIEVGEIKQSRIHYFHGMRRFTVGSDGCEAFDSPDELAVRGGITRAPSTAKPALPALQIVALETSQRRISSRKWTASFWHAYARIHQARVVVLSIVVRRRIQSPCTGQQHHREEQHQQRSLHKDV